MWRPQKSELGAKVRRSKQTSATKRLLQDLKDLNETAIPTVGVVALPLEKDLFTWHCNVRGPKGTMYEGGVFHLILEFPKTYPLDPPTVTVCTTLQHPNVFGTTICLDMLQPGSEQERYMGWSSAYSVQSILIQLQAFLFEESPTLRIEDARKSVEAANNFTCRSCKHRPLRSWPPFPSYEKESFVLEDWDELDLAKEELVCFHSKRNYKEDVLGFGISFTKNIRTGDIQDISSPLDLLGVKAFIRDGIRKSSINEPFTHWVPVYINEEHGIKAFHLAKKALSMICAGNTKEFKPEMALIVFPKLMNTMVVQIMKGQIHASIKALEGYCAFHQMFLKFLLEYPELKAACEAKVTAFLKDEANRHKDVTASLGEFLPLLAVVPSVQWKDAAPAVVNESFTRQVAWLIKEYPELGKEEEDQVDKERINVTFGASLVGYRLLMFHMYFLEHVAKFLGGSVQEMAERYTSLYGRPTVRMVEAMQQGFRDIKKVKNHNDFFTCIGLPTLSDEDLKATLRKSVTQSRLKGYHGVEGPKVPTPEELLEESLKQVVPLKSLCVAGEKGEPGKVLHDNEEEWRALCKTRWGFVALPKDYSNYDLPHPWKHLYLQNNLQDFVHSLNDRPDFPALHEALDLSAPVLKIVEISVTTPKKIKSGFHYITALVSKLPHLQCLSISKGLEGGLALKGSKALVKGLKNCATALKTLNLSYADISEATVILTEGLLAAPNLTALNLEGNHLGQQGIKNLMPVLWNHKSLAELNLSSCGIDSQAAKELADGLLANKKLRVVKLGRNPLADAGVRAIAYNLAFSPAIEHLDLSRVTGTSGGSVGEALAKLFKITVTLTNLNLWKTNIAQSFTQETIQALAENRSITHLDLGQIGSLDSNQLGYFGKTLAINKTLRVLNMESNNISGHGVEMLYHALFLDKTAKEEEKQKEKGKQTKSAREEGDRERRRLEMLDQQKQVEKEFHFELRELNLNNNSLSAGGKILGKVLHIATSLEVLCLEGCSLDASSGETLGLAMEENVSLRILKLKQNGLGKEGAKALASGLERNNKLKLELLDISGNNIGVSGARAFAKVLEKNQSITTFNLFGNLIDVDGARAIALALKNNHSLTSLDLGLNRIRDKGALQLAGIVAEHPALKHLYLKLNFIKDQGALALARAVAKSNVITFSMAGNEFEDVTLMQVYELLKSSGKEEGFDLGSRIAILDPERVARSIWVTPLSSKVTKQAVKKLFYDNHCGVVLNVSIHEHTTKLSPQKAKYAFIEFAHINSVTLALDLSSSGKAWIDRQSVRCYRVGTQTKTDSDAQGQQPPQPPRRGERGGRNNNNRGFGDRDRRGDRGERRPTQAGRGRGRGR